MWAHRKNHILRPFLCREGDCRKSFKTREELISHQKVHLDSGYKCEHCDKVFKCPDCKKTFAFPYLLHKHQKTCKLVRANTKRVVKMVSNKSLLEIKKKYL